MVAISLLFFCTMVPFNMQAQGPVMFEYAGDMKAKMENENYYIYIYCNKYEGSTCTSPDGAVRIFVPNPGAWLKALIIK